MRLLRVVLILLFVVVLVIPLALGGRGGPGTAGVGADRRLIIVSPHNELVRSEFEAAFEQWHLDAYGEAVDVVWSTPGGTSDIRTILVSQTTAALRQGRPVGGTADLLFGGGSYEFQQLTRPVRVARPGVAGGTVEASVLEPMPLEPAFLEALYEADEIGGVPLYDPQGHWYGAALSGFGIVYNRDALRLAYDLDADAPIEPWEPTGWEDLGDHRLRGWLAMVNPSHSGSITTAFDVILQRFGWRRGWAVLRRAAANGRYFSASSLRPPLDVGQGEAAMGVCIDFYGRGQAQAVREAGDPDRLGYVDPAGMTSIDPDPIGRLRGAPHPELAERFVRFVLSREGQALWQLPPGATDDGLGPRRHALRRLPVRRELYRDPELRPLFIDDVNPYEIAEPVDDPQSAYRAFIAPLFSAMAIDGHDELVAAWSAIVEHPAYPFPKGPHAPLVMAGDVEDPQLRSMLEAFDDLPVLPAPGGGSLDLDDPSTVAAAKAGWLRGGFAGDGLWPSAADPVDVLRRRAGAFFRERYRAVRAGRGAGEPVAP